MKRSLQKNIQKKSAAASGRQTSRPGTQPKNQTGLPDNLKAGIENLSGHSMDDVKVHYNSAKPVGLQAHAYAQGTDIHVAPGQERHLPHEAWHVVQQKQGRVKPTRQLKGKVPLNDDGGLEHEADVMGARAAQLAPRGKKPAVGAVLRHGNMASGAPVQAYSVKREPKQGMVYSVSNDESIITGMRTPNHELYVNNLSKIDAMNMAAGRSMIRFKAGGAKMLFNKAYQKVKVGYAKMQTSEKKPTWYNKDNEDVHRVDMDKTYRKMVQQALREKNESKYREVLDVVEQAPWAKHFGDLSRLLSTLVQHLSLFKQLVLVNQAGESYHDVVNDMEYAQRFIDLIEGQIYSKTATHENLSDAESLLFMTARVVRSSGLGNDPLVMDALEDVERVFTGLVHAFPEEHTIDMIWLHRGNYRLGILESIRDDDPLFHRACDTMAATLMGNTVDEENMDQLKLYASQSGSGAHYVPKVLSSGGDWVSMESFAAGAGAETDIVKWGVKDTTGLDNSWQYLMYGSLDKKGHKLSGEDQYFELFTKLRYYQRGIKEDGAFRTDNRDRMNSPIPKDLFVGLPEIDGTKSETIWEMLHFSKVLNENGEVEKPEYLEKGYLRLRLGDYAPLASQISQRMKHQYHTPRINLRHIQNTASNELRNIDAWIEMLGLNINTLKLAKVTEMMSLEGPEGSGKAYNFALKQLITYMSKEGKYLK